MRSFIALVAFVALIVIISARGSNTAIIVGVLCLQGGFAGLGDGRRNSFTGFGMMAFGAILLIIGLVIKSALSKEERTVRMTIEVPEPALAALHKSPNEFAKEFSLAAAVKWYELRQLSQERAAQLARLSRAEFIEALSRFGVSPFQYGAAEIVAETERD
jgi:predicted HTH domain antitoxin